MSKLKKKQEENQRQGVNLGQDIILNRKIVSPERLKILVLSGNELVNEELQFLSRCSNLIKLDISNNKISKFPDKIKWQDITGLKVLFLHGNKITTIEAISSLFKTTSLLYLTYQNSTIVNTTKWEHAVINNIPTLKAIGNRTISLQQRTPEFLDEYFNLKLDPSILEGWKATENSEIYYIRVLNFQLRYLDKLWLLANPVIKLQRFWRKTLRRRVKSKKPKEKGLQKYQLESSSPSQQLQNPGITMLRTYFSSWKQQTKNIQAVITLLQAQSAQVQEKQYLSYPIEEYKIAVRNRKLKHNFLKYLDHIRKKLYMRKMASRLYRNLQMKKFVFNPLETQSFYQLSGIANTHQIYYSKTQQHLLDNFLVHIAENFNKREAIYNMSQTGTVNKYKSIRLVDPVTYANKSCTCAFTYLLWPSMKIILQKSKKYSGKQKKSFISIKTLTYIKNKDKILTKEQIDKSNKVYGQLVRFAQNQYEGNLCYFHCQDKEVMTQLIRYLHYHNTKALTFSIKDKKSDLMAMLDNYNQPFVIYTEKLIERSAAAVCIQTRWRRYISNKRQSRSIYAQMKKKRAVLRVQRFFRDIVFYHRLAFQKHLANYLNTFCSNSFMLPVKVYMNLRQLIEENKNIKLYNEISFESNGNLFSVNAAFGKDVIFPTTRNRFMNGKPTFQKLINGKHIDFYQFMHQNSKIKVLEYAGESFFEFQYGSIEQANLRIAMLALLTYRIANRNFILPICRNNLYILPQVIQMYVKYPILSEHYSSLRNEQSADRIIIKRTVELEGVLIHKKGFKNEDCSTIDLEFYQKKYRSFPEKHTGQLKYQLLGPKPQSVLKEIESQRDTSPLNNKMLKNAVTRRNSMRANAQTADNPFNVSQIDRKRLSFFESNPKSMGNETIQKSEKTTFQKLQKTVELEKKRSVIQKYHEVEVQKRENIKERKKEDLRSIRGKIKHEKMNNLTHKNMKEFERTEELRKKVERVKDLKSRVAANNASETQFMQQGNFVMEQQLKMVIMRNKMKEKESKRQSKISSFYQTRSRFTENGKTESAYSSHSASQHNEVKEEEDKSGVRATIEVRTENEIVNSRMHTMALRKTRTNSIGAYIRDPSFVHGVFPEQYYPIENRGHIFPPL